MDAVAILALLALLFSKRRGASAGSVPQMKATFANAWRDRTLSLMQRARSGAAWVPRMTVLLGNPGAGAAAGRWIGIESGGDPRASSSLSERGLAQVSKQSLKELLLTDNDFEQMTNARTTDDRHAELAAKVIWGEVVLATKSLGSARAPDPGWGPAIGPSALTLKVVSVNGIGIAKVRHALPLLLLEMAVQGHVRASIKDTIRSMLTGGTVNGIKVNPFKPSDRLTSFVKGANAVTGDPTQDLIVRFLAPVAVVSLAEDAFQLAALAVA